MSVINRIKRMGLRLFGKVLPTDIFSTRFPVSVKGVCLFDDRVVLLENERNEWDLPGGKLDKGEDLAVCLQREIAEELDIPVSVERLLHVGMLKIMNITQVLIVLYLCRPEVAANEIRISYEHRKFRLFSMDEAMALNIPEPYRLAIQKAFSAAARFREQR